MFFLIFISCNFWEFICKDERLKIMLFYGIIIIIIIIIFNVRWVGILLVKKKQIIMCTTILRVL